MCIWSVSYTHLKNTIAEALEQNPQNQITKESLDEMSIEEIGQMMQMELTTYEAENDNGEMVTYVDMRPMMQQLIASGAMTQDGIAQSRDCLLYTSSVKYMPRHIQEDKKETTGNTLCEFLTTCINRKREQSFLKKWLSPFFTLQEIAFL